MQDALAALEQTYMTLQQQVGMLSLNCDDDQKKLLISQLVAARAAYWNCVNKAFHDDDPQVGALTAQLQASNQQLQKATQQMATSALCSTRSTTRFPPRPSWRVLSFPPEGAESNKMKVPFRASEQNLEATPLPPRVPDCGRRCSRPVASVSGT